MTTPAAGGADWVPLMAVGSSPAAGTKDWVPVAAVGSSPAAGTKDWVPLLSLAGTKVVVYAGQGPVYPGGEVGANFNAVTSDWTVPLGLEDGQNFTLPVVGTYRVQAYVTYPGYNVVGWTNGWSGEFWGTAWVRIRSSLGTLIYDSPSQSINTTDVNQLCAFSFDVTVTGLHAGDKVELVFSGAATGYGPRQWNASMTLTHLNTNQSRGTPPSISPLTELNYYDWTQGGTVVITNVYGGGGWWAATYDPSGDATYPWRIDNATNGIITSGVGSSLPPYEGSETEAAGTRLTLPCAGIWNHRSYGSFDGVNVGGVWLSNHKSGRDVAVYGTEDQAWHQSTLPVGSYEYGSSEWGHKYASGSGGWESVQVEYFPARIKAP